MSDAPDDPLDPAVALAGARFIERERDIEILELCELAGRDAEALRFIRSDMTAEQVRRYLIDERRKAATRPALAVAQPRPAAMPARHAEAFTMRGLRVG